MPKNLSLLGVSVLIGSIAWDAFSKKANPDSLQAEPSPILQTSESTETGDPGTISDQQLVHAPKISDAERERHRRLIESPDRFYDPDNRSPVYLQKVARHQMIAHYLQSPIKDEASMRTLMEMLLERGYDLPDWLHATNMLGMYHLSRNMLINGARLSGAHSEEIETISARYDTDHPHLKSIIEGFKHQTGIRDSDFVTEILRLEFPERALQESMAGPPITLSGDLLYDDTSWLDPAFQMAKMRGLKSNRTPPAHKPKPGISPHPSYPVSAFGSVAISENPGTK